MAYNSKGKKTSKSTSELAPGKISPRKRMAMSGSKGIKKSKSSKTKGY